MLIWVNSRNCIINIDACILGYQNASCQIYDILFCLNLKAWQNNYK